MAEIDFITALGRLLRDGNLRDAFAADPQAVVTQINLCRNDWSAFLQLVAEDLEFQARILLRKRHALVQRLLPETVRRLDEKCWLLFFEYSRANWPADKCAALRDALQFCEWIKRQQPGFVSESEWNRLQFGLSEKHLAIHWFFRETIRGKARLMTQTFFRGRSKRWREFVFYFPATIEWE